MTLLFEQARYGDRPVGPDDLERISRRYRQIFGKIDRLG